MMCCTKAAATIDATKFILPYYNSQRATGIDPIPNTQVDSLARGPKLLSIKNYVNQLTDDELTTGYYQQDGATCHTSNASMREIQSVF